MKKFVVGILCFLIAGGAGFFGIQFFTKTGLFRNPGELVFAESFLDSEAEEYRELFSETTLDKDLVFSYVSETSLRSGDPEGTKTFLVDVIVPIEDFYSTVETIPLDEFDRRVASGENVVSVSELDSSEKLIAVDGRYFLDSFSDGAMFKYLRIEGGEKDLKTATELITPTLQSFPEKSNTLSMAQTGVTAFGRGLNSMMNSVGDGKYFSEKIGEYLRSFDLTHTSNEASFSENASSANICADERFLDTLTDIGLDIVELTGNHNLDCGAEDAIATIEKYEQAGIKIVGGGRNAEEAARPLSFNQKGSGITMLAYNESTGGATTGDTPGANQYSEEDARERISEAKARGDIVIVDMQYFECSEYDSAVENTACDYANSSDGDQIGVFRNLIDLGADVVVGTSAHQPQTFEKYGRGEIYYGLGNIFFDQVWWPGTTRSLGLVHYFWDGKLVQTRRFGTVYDSDLQTRLMDDSEMEYFIERLAEARPL